MSTGRSGVISYRMVGDGPGVVLLHGGAQSGHNLMILAKLLSQRFTVYVPDRRGRGASGGYERDHGLATEVADLRELLADIGAHNVFGLSSGAVIALEAARTLVEIERLAVFEPPLLAGDPGALAWVSGYERHLQHGRTAAALVIAMKGTAEPPALRFVPTPVAAAMMAPGLRKSDAKAHAIGVPGPSELISTMHFDAITVGQAAGPLDRFGAVTAAVLLLGGAKSPAPLASAQDGLELVLPEVCRVTLPGVGHLAAEMPASPASLPPSCSASSASAARRAAARRPCRRRRGRRRS